MKKQNKLSPDLSSSGIDLKRLEKETYRYLYLGLIVAVIFHAAVLFLYPIKKPPVKDLKNLPVELITIPPKITKPIIISKQSPSGIYRFRRKISAAQPSKIFDGGNIQSFNYGDLRKKFLSGKDGLAIPTDNLPDSITFQEKLNGRPKDTVPLKNDVFIDTGQYKSMVVFPPDNKMAVQGYTHIASICGKDFSPSDFMTVALKNLAGALNFYTNIKTDCSWRVELKDAQNYPIIYISYDKPFNLIEEEIKILTEYISSGGFIIIDNPINENDNGAVGKSLKNVVIRAFSGLSEAPYLEITPVGPVTKYRVSPLIPETSFIPIPKNHELFHCFFDFEDCSPGRNIEDSVTKKVIEGIYLGGRLIGLYTVGYGPSWNDKRNEEQLKMGVNIVVYALKQGKGKFDWGHITPKTPTTPSVVFVGSGKMKNLSKENVKVW